MDTSIRIHRFEELSALEVHALYKLRTDIFVVEQNCPYPEVDEADLHARHALLTESNTLVGTARIIMEPRIARIGRVAIHREHRGKGLARELMNACMDFIRKEKGAATISVSAQTYLHDFYASLGFEFTGEAYLEDGLPHIEMLRIP